MEIVTLVMMEIARGRRKNKRRTIMIIVMMPMLMKRTITTS